MSIDEISEYFKNHTLKQCAQKFGCAPVTIKRHLKAAGIDTSIHNHSDLARQAYLATQKDTSKLTREFLYNEYMIFNKDAKTIAEENGFHFNTVRSRIRGFGIHKSSRQVSISMQLRYQKKTGYRHPGCHPDNLRKVFKARSRYHYKGHLFKSLHELTYALLIDHDTTVQNWDYELICVPYIDRLTGKHRTYYIDFSIQRAAGDEWIEVKPQDRMIPEDKYLYASAAANKAGARFRGITGPERDQAFELLKSGYNSEHIEFVNPGRLRPETTYTLWFKDTDGVDRIQHDHYTYTTRIGPYIKCRFQAKQANKS